MEIICMGSAAVCIASVVFILWESEKIRSELRLVIKALERKGGE